MAITVKLVGSDTPQRVQIVVSATTNGAAWTLYGQGGGLEWIVPGGQGVGDGAQLSLTDNRGPLNTPITYRFVSTATQVATAITVRQTTGDATLESLDGQIKVNVNLQAGTDQYDLDPDIQLFRVPGRRRPVVRYSDTSDARGQIIFRAPMTSTPKVDQLFSSGAPILCRMTSQMIDLPRVIILGLTGITTSTASVVTQVREWSVGYVTLDDPYLDQRLGAFSWDYFDQVWSGKTWNTFNTNMAGRSWNQFDTIDWSTM